MCRSVTMYVCLHACVWVSNGSYLTRSNCRKFHAWTPHGPSVTEPHGPQSLRRKTGFDIASSLDLLDPRSLTRTALSALHSHKWGPPPKPLTLWGHHPIFSTYEGLSIPSTLWGTSSQLMGPPHTSYFWGLPYFPPCGGPSPYLPTYGGHSIPSTLWDPTNFPTYGDTAPYLPTYRGPL